jgi:hypothetical protein
MLPPPSWRPGPAPPRWTRAATRPGSGQRSARASPQPDAPAADRRHEVDPAEGVSDAERDRAWKRIMAAADRHGVEVCAATSWRNLAKGGKDRER